MTQTQLRTIIDQSQRIVFFGGAGVSTESGIPDFRSAQGLFNQETGMVFPPEVVLGYTFFATHPAEFFDYYKAHLLYPHAEPNPAHRALAALEDQGKLRAVITQNIDGLHQQAGSNNVLELHGSAHKNYCLGCFARYTMDYVLASEGIPTCEQCGEIVRPDVVLYEEGLDPEVIERSIAELQQADTLIVSGTSLVVYPAAGLVHEFRGKNLVVINKDRTPADNKATLAIHAPVGETLAFALDS
ncbi:MAG: NAD-dependent protein deacylase [Propionibacteriaceae bacterium]|nr:NAD-dependent protein deacylase [Propionibacteriaceae bacterium]